MRLIVTRDDDGNDRVQVKLVILLTSQDNAPYEEFNSYLLSSAKDSLFYVYSFGGQINK